jgi:DNA-binding transcriptional LysR family regulator
MDIAQLKYFVCIVESNFNLSLAAQKLHLSQPALSQVILKFEAEEHISLFVRKQGRLCSLSSSGESFYENAKQVISHHERMIKELREHSLQIRGKIRIGIPPLVLTVLFTDVLAKLVTLNPDIQFDIIEEGAFELQRLLKLQEIDYAIILQPTDLNSTHFKEEIIYQDELTCFMCSEHPLAKKSILSWHDLKNQPIALFKETFMIHHQVKRKFESLKMVPNIALMSSSWDFLLESTLNSDFVTILPRPINKHFSQERIKMLRFKNPMPWIVVLTYANKPSYNRIETYTRQSIFKYFRHEIGITPIDEQINLKR